MHMFGLLEFPAANAMAPESLGVTSLQNAYCSILDLVLQGVTMTTGPGKNSRNAWQPLRNVLRPVVEGIMVSDLSMCDKGVDSLSSQSFVQAVESGRLFIVLAWSQ